MRLIVQRILSVLEMKSIEFSDLAGRCAGRQLLLVCSGPTAVCYEDLPGRYDVAVFVNHAVKLAPLFDRPEHETFFVTGHPKVFTGCEAVLHPRLHVLSVPFSSCFRCAREVVCRARNYTWKEPDVFWEQLGRPESLDRERLARTGELLLMCNSTHLALHFIYYLAPMRVDVVGASRCRGELMFHHDPRLSAGSVAYPQLYIESFQKCVDTLGLNVCTLGD